MKRVLKKYLYNNKNIELKKTRFLFVFPSVCALRRNKVRYR